MEMCSPCSTLHGSTQGSWNGQKNLHKYTKKPIYHNVYL